MLSRVIDLADREPGSESNNAAPSRSLIPLEEILSVVLGRGVNTKTVQKEYMRLVTEGGSEFKILLDMSLKDLSGLCDDRTTEAIIRVREGNINITPGFDGEFGKIDIFANG